MNSIVKFTCNFIKDTEISCVIVKGEPWFKAKEIAIVLGYVGTKKAVRTHVDEDDKIYYKDIDGTSHGYLNVPVGGTLSNAVFINESGLYSLILRSNKAEAKTFKQWVTNDILPQIRKTGVYSTDYNYYRNEFELGTTSSSRWREIKRLARGREDELHYLIVEHITKIYPDAIINSGMGEHLTTDHARMDARLKGYTGGQPDMIVMRALPNGFHNILAIELKNPNKKKQIVKQTNRIQIYVRTHL